MKNLRIVFCLVALVLLISGCETNQHSNVETSQPSTVDTPKTFNNSALSISSEGNKWNEDKNALPFEQVIDKVSFKVKEPEVPFEVTHKAASLITDPFVVIQLTYANEKVGYQLVLAESNSDKFKPGGKVGPHLKDGTETKVQSNQHSSVLAWRKNGMTFTLITTKIEDGEFVPLYDVSKLKEIANSINEIE
ncbi:hypothetical protein [Cohnella sp. REN36]|uniref:hypothetical protein n=1 Tax=Cohnella sp. REN36 TaxID=2887347 RepID=UPI001D14AE09|nr:hypothetical protein [Cohnella sp. REN36]MCC3375025.1 hypothetical protein [Cohnella sp. REN36]